MMAAFYYQKASSVGYFRHGKRGMEIDTLLPANGHIIMSMSKIQKCPRGD